MSKKYQVIGGQYHAFNYGETNYLHEAKKIALEHEEEWDCGLVIRPDIYKSIDCEFESTCFGIQIVPKPWASPFLAWSGIEWIQIE